MATENDERRPLLQFPPSEEATSPAEEGLVPHPARKTPQYLAAFCASLGAFATGAIIGWSSPAGPRITTGNELGFIVTQQDNAWVGSLMTLGATAICFPTGHMMEKIGRKTTMLLLIFPFMIGWFLILLSVNIPMLFFGRFIVGIAGGGFCVAVPAYTSEIAQDDIRGTVGTFFQVMVTSGVLYAYIVGSYLSIRVMTGLCAIIPVVFGLIFLFFPESPYFLVYKNRLNEAKNSLIRLRGPQYDVQGEYEELCNRVAHDRANPVTLKEAFARKATKKALFICLMLMVFQQFSGINAVLFNATHIFQSAKVNVSESLSTIIIGSVQVAATLLSTFAVDKLGRRILLLFSSVTMCLSFIALGTFFYLLELKNPDQALLDSLSWLPLMSLCTYIVAFSTGFGPIPWLVSGELCTSDVKAFISSFAGSLCWFLSFVITRCFDEMKSTMGDGGVFWFFAACMVLATVFVFFVMPETKGKSHNEIQRILNGDVTN